MSPHRASEVLSDAAAKRRFLRIAPPADLGGAGQSAFLHTESPDHVRSLTWTKCQEKPAPDKVPTLLVHLAPRGSAEAVWWAASTTVLRHARLVRPVAGRTWRTATSASLGPLRPPGRSSLRVACKLRSAVVSVGIGMLRLLHHPLHSPEVAGGCAQADADRAAGWGVEHAPRPRLAWGDGVRWQPWHASPLPRAGSAVCSAAVMDWLMAIGLFSAGCGGCAGVGQRIPQRGRLGVGGQLGPGAASGGRFSRCSLCDVGAGDGRIRADRIYGQRPA